MSEDAAARIATRETVPWQADARGLITVRRRKFGPIGTAILRLFRVAPDLTVHLDALGSDVWRLLDGQRTVSETLAALEAAHPDEADLPERLGGYLSRLAAARLIRLK